MNQNHDVEVSIEVQKLLTQLQSATVRLVKLEPAERLPSVMASGLLVQRRGRYFIITVAHAITDGCNWVEVDAVRDGQPACLLVPLVAHWSLLQSITLPDRTCKIDLSWAEINLDRLRRQAQNDAALSSGSVQLVEYRGPLGERPSVDDVYAFSALSQPVAFPRSDGVYCLERRPTLEWGMTYAGSDAGGLYTFRLSREHQGHDYYKGASGAPIADATGRVVSVVVGGDPGLNVIYGARLAAYERLIGKDFASQAP